ncbi:hypothetical protein [Aurantiacibacter zhengii]|uniref:Serine kinase n=1 Tax=Aurantiacibacter zhengii TaxID=2307003 RepID=A0A418NRT6_9SPHN|nr:hypothetical protein [Aurantiacibacter zhengii]RIV85635.1 hypothetical protein D2V07_09820 [Aurantiacibacter zhengii]
MTFHYRAYGLDIEADLPLRALCAHEGGPDVRIVKSEVPDRLDTVEAKTPRWTANARELLIDVPNVARFHIHDGRKITYQPVNGASAEDVEAYLLGSCMGGVLHQRHLLVLHAAAISVGDRAFAICGKSGLGKSTTSAHLVEQGAELLSDDLAVFDRQGECVQPGYAQTKLTPGAIEGLVEPGGEMRKLAGERGKFAIARHQQFRADPAPIAGLFVIERTSSARPSLEQLEPGLVAQYLRRHTYRKGYIVPGNEAEHVRRCIDLAYRIPAWLALRPQTGDSTNFIVSAISEAIEATDFRVETGN